MAKNTANIDLVPREALEELKALDSQLNATKATLIELLKPVVTFSEKMQSSALSIKTLRTEINEYRKVEEQVNNEFAKQKTVVSAIEKAQQKLMQLQTDEARQLAILKEKIRQKNKENEESAKIMLKEAEAAQTLRKKLAEIGKEKTVTIKTKNITENVNINTSKGNENVAKNASYLQQQFNNISSAGFTDISGLVQKNEQGLKNYSSAINELSSRLAYVTSLQNDYKKALDAGNVSEEDYKDKIQSIVNIQKALESELNNLNDKYKINKQTISENSVIAAQATDAFANLSDKGKELTLTILEAGEAQKQIKSSLANLDKEYEKGNISLGEYTEKKAELITLSNTYKDVTKSASRELGNEIKATQSSIGSYNNLSARYSIIKDQLDQMTKAGGKSTEQFEKMQEEAKSLYEEMKKLQSATGKEQLNVGNYPEEVKGLTREIENNVKQLALMKVRGEDNTEEYKKLAKETAVLKDAMMDATAEIKNMASDTSTLNSVLGFAAAAGGGFATITGAMQLFGGESENVAEAQKKLQSVIAITTGIQTLQNSIQKQSALMLGISKIQSIALTKAETIRNTTTKSGSVATAAATIAQKSFNAVAKANPYVLLATALISVTGALVAFSSSSNKAAEQQERLNKLTEIRIELLDQESRKIKESSDVNIAAIEHEIELAKIRNASTQEIRELEDKLYQERRSANKNLSSFMWEYTENIEENKKKLDKYSLKLKELQEIQQNTGNSKIEIEIDGEISKMKVEDAINSIQGKIDNLGKEVEIGTKLKEESDELERQAEIIIAKREKEDIENAKKYQEKINKIKESESKAALEISNEQIKYSANKNKEIAEDENRSYDERIAALHRFAEDMKQSVNNIADQQINNIIKQTAEELNLDPIKDRVKIEKKVSQQINLIKLKSSHETEKIAKETAETSVEIAKEAAENSVKIEKERVDKILDQIARETDARNRKISGEESEEYNTLAKEYSSGLMSDEVYQAKRKAISDKYTTERFKVEADMLQKSLDQTNLTEDERNDIQKRLADNRLEYEKWVNEQEIAAAEELADKKKQLLQDVFDFGNQLVQQRFENQLKELEEEAEANNEWTEEEKERIDRLEESGAISKEQADAQKAAIDQQAEKRAEKIEQKKKELQKKQAIYEKAMAIAQIAWNTAQAIMAAWTNPWSAPGMIPLIIAAGAVQSATVLATPIPEYAQGTPDHPGGLAIVGDGGKSEMIISNGRIFKTPSSDTLLNLPEHSMVLPDFNMAMEEMKILKAPCENRDSIGIEKLSEQFKESNKSLHELVRRSIIESKNSRYTRELNNVHSIKRR